MPTYNNVASSPVPWSEIATVLLDMDGTLLDKYFDDYFWEEYVPYEYAKTNGIDYLQARSELLRRYQAVENTLQWTDLDFWSEQLGLDIFKLKLSIDHLIQVHPHVDDFLAFLTKQGKEVIMVTAAHRKTLQIKLDKTGLASRFDRIICAEELGHPKESPLFWSLLEEHIGFARCRTLFADDTVKVLQAARQHGICHLIHVAKPSSRNQARFHEEFISIAAFDELLHR